MINIKSSRCQICRYQHRYPTVSEPPQRIQPLIHKTQYVLYSVYSRPITYP